MDKDMFYNRDKMYENIPNAQKKLIADVEEIKTNGLPDEQARKDISSLSETVGNQESKIDVLSKENTNLHLDTVVQFNADNTGKIDSSEALKNAIIQAIKNNATTANQKITVYLPAGTFNIDLNKVFSNFDFTSLGLTTTVKKGLRFVGAGRYSTILKLVTNGTEKWFYDNESINSQKFSHIFFEHMSFTTDDVSKGHGFKQWSQGGEKQFRFFDCDFELGTIMQFEGVGNADLNRFLLCSITSHETTFIYNNNQSVSNELISCDLNMKKGFINVKNQGGGSFKVFGGNFEMHPHTTDTTDHYLFTMEDNPILGQGNCDFNFNDIRFEIHGINKKLVYTTLNDKPLNINFTRCQFGTVPDGSREVVRVTPTKRVVFDNCILNDNFTYKVEGDFATSSGTPSGAQLMFYKCDVGRAKNLYERITKTGNVYRVKANECFRQSSSVGSNVVPQDFDYGWDNIAPMGVTANRKVIPIKQTWTAFPVTGSNEKVLTIPTGCFITKIYIKKPAVASTSSDYNLKIGNDDKSIVLGESGLKPHNQDHIITLQDTGVLAYNKLRLWAEGTATTSQSGGVAYIEYI
jgi:Pectate lyase superfamily protein